MINKYLSEQIYPNINVSQGLGAKICAKC